MQFNEQELLAIKLLDKDYKERHFTNHYHVNRIFTALLTSGDIIYQKKVNHSDIILRAMQMKIGDQAPLHIEINFSNVCRISGIINKKSEFQFETRYYIKTNKLQKDIWNYYSRFGFDQCNKENYYVNYFHNEEHMLNVVDSDPLTNGMISHCDEIENNDEMKEFKIMPKNEETKRLTIELQYNVTHETMEFSKTHDAILGGGGDMVYFSFDFEYFMGG